MTGTGTAHPSCAPLIATWRAPPAPGLASCAPTSACDGEESCTPPALCAPPARADAPEQLAGQRLDERARERSDHGAGLAWGGSAAVEAAVVVERAAK
eukprot:CAMPEP_0196728230 /NCGR_PEP_ID=MMETSP1091-20130531/8964_1 /TAXON_ID=302021 /ORGANISM="Rhodomonas sp., Strain CCMP768" /LENGTH=97 /DNA_ID=CAMNT_0042070949 /DNA_START=304 /DNA_END=598 /DNA_ORIENTATION=-